MKNLTDYINEQLNTTEEVTIDEAVVNEGEIKSEEDFRAAAKAKFEEAFGDELDESKMNDTIEGILNDNKELVEAGEWGELIGILNKSF
jgi:hypothetical protein